MLLINQKTLPRTLQTYVGFRLAFFDTRERLELAFQLNLHHERNFGYLTQVPFLRNVPPHVQLELLLQTWAKHYSAKPFSGNLVDESVIYAACETAAHLVRRDRKNAQRHLQRGPALWSSNLDAKYASQLQDLHLSLTGEGHFLLLSQFQDIPPEDSLRLKQKYGIDNRACDCMFDALSRWHVSDGVETLAEGLLTPTEIERTRSLLQAFKSAPRTT